MNVRKRKVRINRPHSFANFLQKSFRACARTPNAETHVIRHRVCTAFEMNPHDRPVDHGGRILADTVTVNVGGDADNLAPVVCGGDTNAFAKSVGWGIPILASKILRNDGNRKLLIDVRPCEIPACDQGSAFSGKKTRNDESEAANRRNFSLHKWMILREKDVVVGVTVHWKGG